MELNNLTAISPIDGRYRNRVDELDVFFSEYGLIKYRILVEIEYFIALCKIPLPELKEIDHSIFSELQKIYQDFSIRDAERVKEIEKITNHDVKSVEYFIKEKFDALGLAKFREFVHFALTSQDISNTAIPYSLRDAMNKIYHPLLNKLLNKLNILIVDWAEIPMLAHTHGQPASPTILGKEIKVFHERVIKQLDLLKEIPCSAKFGGATGNFNAHYVAYPKINWVEFADKLVNETLGLDRSKTTTQIEHYDNLSAIFDNLKRINTVLIDLCRDIWTYISLEYFKQKINKGEVGSSTMPHKVNPIDFENAEGNLGVANAIFEHLSAKLPVSRLQRDLTDSTVLRNIGVPIAHTVISIKSILKGLDKLIINKEKIDKDLEKNWVVVTEGLQTVLRREGFKNPYEIIKDLTRTNKYIDKKVFDEFIDKLNISEKLKKELKQITPFNYTGI